MAAAASGGDGPPVPFNDEESFKAWMAAGNKNSKKTAAVDDFKEPDADELETVKKLRALLSKRNQGTDDLTLSRFIRGYYYLHFAEAEDRLERTAIITNLALDWMREIDFENLHSKKLPKRDEWDKIWPTCVSGVTQDQRAVWFATAMGDIKKYSLEEVGMFHAQDMAVLREGKMRVMELAGRKFTGVHHVCVLDAGWEDGPGIDRGLLKYLKEALIHRTGANTTQHFQPDALAKAFVINTPFLYRALFSFARLFMEATTAAKYHVIGSDFMPTLEAAGITREALPMYLGGLAPNPKALVQRVKVDRGKREVLTCLIGKWQTSDTLVWQCSFTKGECDVTITDASGKQVGGKGKLTLGLTPDKDEKITIDFDNTAGSGRVHAEIICYCADTTTDRASPPPAAASSGAPAPRPMVPAGAGAD